MTEKEIILRLANYGDHVRRYELMVPNVCTSHDNEADLFCVRKSGLCDEFEVKVSRSDFLSDSKKHIRYRNPEGPEQRLELDTPWCDRFSLPHYKPKHQALAEGDTCVNYFWFAVTEGVATIDDVPHFAGLIIITPERLRIAKAPDKLHVTKLSYADRYKVARKSTYRYWKLRNQAA